MSKIICPKCKQEWDTTGWNVSPDAGMLPLPIHPVPVFIDPDRPTICMASKQLVYILE